MKNYSRRQIQKANICLSAGIVADSELQPIVILSASVEANPLLCASSLYFKVFI